MTIETEPTQKPKLGRTLKLDDDLITNLCAYISRGNYIITACRACGIADHTYYDYIKQGEYDLENGVDSIFSHFIQQLKRAEAQAEADRVGRIEESGRSGNWLADMTHLERRHPERWGRKDRIQVDEKKEIKISVVVKHYQEELPAPAPAGQVIVDGECREVPQIEANNGG